MRKYFEEKMGEAIAVLCSRYWYRGIVAEANDDYVVLSNFYAVEETGLPTDAQATTECHHPGDGVISYNAIELVCQPVWAFHGYEIKTWIRNKKRSIK